MTSHKLNSATVIEKSVENRHLKRKTPFGNIRVTYLQSYKYVFRFHPNQFPPDVPFLFEDGDEDPNGNSTMATHHRCTPGSCSQPPEEIDFDKGLFDLVAKLRPTHIVGNGGWSDPGVDVPCVFQACKEAHPDVQVTYVPNPPARDTKMPSDYDGVKKKCITHNGTVRVVDRTAPALEVPGTWYWDRIHQLSLLNQVYNEQVIDDVCGSVTAQE